MTCKLCEAIRAGMPVTADTPLPCRLRPDSHDPDPTDPFHGASFSPPNGAKTFELSFVRELNDHLDSTTAEQRVAMHATHVARATAHLDEVANHGHDRFADLNPHPLDALTKKDG